MELTIAQAIALIREKLSQAGDSPIKNLALRQCSQLLTNVDKLGVGGTKVVSLPTPPPLSGKPLSARSERAEEQKGARVTTSRRGGVEKD
jgi:hypothetical protein